MSQLVRAINRRIRSMARARQLNAEIDAAADAIQKGIDSGEIPTERGEVLLRFLSSLRPSRHPSGAPS